MCPQCLQQQHHKTSIPPPKFKNISQSLAVPTIARPWWWEENFYLHCASTSASGCELKIFLQEPFQTGA
ncbi:hypothetical protein CEXT_537961 [Caerostris extrusa]|uniref:Uncharacterized protein n=1 Tax=Caerostris extrusa TaxID=172846 RepID=A0AAV4XIZ1_CAEEX|nr:hypothetical protein CEXT_537961 [Caerostris extrusa]